MPQLRTKKQFELKKKTERKNEIIKKVGSKIPSPKSLGKIALKATPPGMMLTAAQKIKEEFNRLTKRKKKPEAKTGPVKKSKKVPADVTKKRSTRGIKGPKTSNIKRTNKKRKM